MSEDARDPIVRLARLLDPGSLDLWWDGAESGFRAANGTVHSTPVVAFAADPARMGGAMGTEGCALIADVYHKATDHQIPVIGIWHSGGARLTEGVAGLDAVGRIFAAMTAVSGRIPQISLVLGPAAGGAAYGPALTDLVVLGPDGRVFVTGPDVVASVTGEQADQALLGGPEPHGRASGVVHVVSPDDNAAFTATRALIDLLGAPGRLDLEAVHDTDLAAGLPTEARKTYDVRPIAERLLDVGTAIELQPEYAPNVVTMLGRIGGRTVGVIANNPQRLGGCLDWPSAEKAARFVRMCDAFGVPLAVLVDTPGYLPGVGQEWDGVVRRGAKLLHAFGAATVPRVTVVTRKAFGGAYIAMNSRSLGATRVFAWPGAEIAVMGAVAAVRVLHRRALAAAEESERPALEATLAAQHTRDAGGVDAAVAAGIVDDIIAPARTRTAVARAIAGALTEPPARGAHSNMPL
ncbi:acyl-CoA carboxylase subunit beta [Sporichthya sp.]|uniref:acyl-CoA carboxylase subunit beta n=1 Tax=Sporichthya sp. TaxID=65475 RepID=UPI0017E2F468|nr:carboxyl transferase domain-containing protein [Sporichthya sp.]MBA3743442.1 acyl-CoA carboxylase subunit beta [Sporichthya sp.]